MKDAGERLRFVTACLFRWWGNKLNKKKSASTLFGVQPMFAVLAGAGWPSAVGKGEFDVSLWDFSEQEIYLSHSRCAQWTWPPSLQSLYEQTPFTYGEVAKA